MVLHKDVFIISQHVMDIPNIKFNYSICKLILNDFNLVEDELNIFICFSLQLAATEHNVSVPENRNITFYIPAISIRVKRKGWRVLFSKCALIIYSVLKNMFPFGQKNLQLPPDHTVSVGMVVPM